MLQIRSSQDESQQLRTLNLSYAVAVIRWRGMPTMSLSDVDNGDDVDSETPGPSIELFAMLRDEPPMAERRPEVGPR